MHFPSMKADNPAQHFYYKYPVSLQSAAVDNAYHLQPTLYTSKTLKSNKPDSADAIRESHTVNAAKPIDLREAHTEQPRYTNDALQLNDQHSSQTKPAAIAGKPDVRHQVNAFIRSPEDFLYHQQGIVLNPSSVPINRPEAALNHAYYNQVTPEKYMIRPIYVRLLETYPGKFMVDQMALNRETQIAHTHHATLQ